MKIGILGSGNVGKALAKGFISENHEVYLATREPEGIKGTQLRAEIDLVNVCDFATAAKEAELAILCTPWDAAEDAVKAAGAENLAGKIVIDTNNPLNRGEDGVSLAMGFEVSASETVQRWLPDSQVVKCFNTVGAVDMYRPDFPQTPTMFLCGNDASAKQQVSELVQSFGWEPLDMGDIKAARLLEPMAVVWINYVMQAGDSHHAFKML